MSKLITNTIRHTGASSDAITLASDGGCTANITNELGHRRMNINGAMKVNQRGTVTGITASQYAGPDRYRFGLSSHGTFTVSQDSSAPTGSGFANSLKLACTTADTSVAATVANYFQHKLEGQDCQSIKKGTSSAKQLAVQFWVKSNKTGTYAFEVIDGDNNRSFTTTYAISSADTWEKKTITVPADTTGALDDDNNTSLTFNFWLAAGSNYTSGSASASWAAVTSANEAYGHNINIADSTSNTWYMTGFQVELGSQHTDYEHRSYGDELARCQRYYFKRESDDGTDTMFGVGFASSGSYFQTMTFFPVTMRTAPTALETNGTASHYRLNWSGGNNTGSGVTFSTATKYSGQIQFQGGSFTDGQSGYLRSNDSSAYVAWSAEL